MDDSSDLEFSDDESWGEKSDEKKNTLFDSLDDKQNDSEEVTSQPEAEKKVKGSSVPRVNQDPFDSSVEEKPEVFVIPKHQENSYDNIDLADLGEVANNVEIGVGIDIDSGDEIEMEDIDVDIEIDDSSVDDDDASEQQQNRKYERITAKFDFDNYEPDLELVRSVSEELRDVKYGAALVVVVAFALLIWGTSYVREPHSHLLPSNWSSVYTKAFMVCVVLLSCALAVAAVYLVANKKVQLTPELLQHVAIASTISLVVLSIYIMVKGWFIIGLFTLCFIVADTSRMFQMQEEAQFATVLLTIIHETYQGEKPIVRLTLIILSFQVTFLILWSIHFVDMIQCHDVANFHFTGVLQIILTFSILFWVSGIIRGILSLVAVGVFTNKIMDESSSSQEVAELLLKRSMAISFGSLCAGSFRLNITETFITIGWVLDAILSFLRVNNNSGGQNSSRKVKDRIEQMFEYGTYYAWARVGLRGLSFAASSRATWHKISAQGMDFVLYGTYVEHVFRFLGWMNGSIFALWFAMLLVSQDHALITILAIVSICNVVSRVVMEPWQAAVSSVFICYAEHPDALSIPHPILYHRFVRISELQAFDTNRQHVNNVAS